MIIVMKPGIYFAKTTKIDIIPSHFQMYFPENILYINIGIK